MKRYINATLSTALLTTLLLLTGCDKEATESESAKSQNTAHDNTMHDNMAHEGSAHTEDVAPVGHTQSHRESHDTTATTRPNFGILAAEYGNEVNELLADTEFADKTSTDIIEGNSGNGFVIDYPYQISLSGAVNDSGKLSSLTYTMPLNSDIEESGQKLSQLVTASMQVLNHEQTKAESKAKVASLLDQAFSNFIMQGTQQRSIGKVDNNIYVCDISDRGVRLIIEPAEGSRYNQ